MNTTFLRRSLVAATAALTLAAGFAPAAWAQTKLLLRISTPAVPDD